MPSVVRKGGDMTKLHDATSLKDLGIERMQSSRFQRVASLPENVAKMYGWQPCRASSRCALKGVGVEARILPQRERE